MQFRHMTNLSPEAYARVASAAFSNLATARQTMWNRSSHGYLKASRTELDRADREFALILQDRANDLADDYAAGAH